MPPLVDAHVFDITRVIQLAVAPVFLLSAIGTIINALTTRLGRAIDRRRVIDSILLEGVGEAVTVAEFKDERTMLARRIVLVLWAIGSAVFSALLVCILIGIAFLGAFTSLDLSRTVAILFIAAVVALTLCLMLFMREVFLAAAAAEHPVRIRQADA